ncbi:hypothetical protein KFL_000570445 [Klebsormidium nitens]|uniref:Uncharacterized protein n=1 Tax=Klebsormidium nitens TaxID=105231 RepID=A0A0U9HIF0_KLENI|nr:hypothetical protein KFL_000570445 [Klebsormidium nitens]|eukprot:GAQ80598.1 hypothetical protein KFL_000570445 [Klebsormidium nitens]
MAGVFRFLEAACLTAFDVAQGAVSGGLDPLCSSWRKLTFDELLFEMGRGVLMGALEGLLGEEEGAVVVGGEEGVVVSLEGGEERDEEEGVVFVGGEEGAVFVGGEEGEVFVGGEEGEVFVQREEGVEDSLGEGEEREEELGRAQEEGPEESGRALFEEDADQQAAPSALAGVADSPSAAPLVSFGPELTHDESQGDSDRAGEAPFEVSTAEDAAIFSGDAFAPAQIPSGFGGISSDPDFDFSPASSASQLRSPRSSPTVVPPVPVAQDLVAQDSVVHVWTEVSTVPLADVESRSAGFRAHRSSMLMALEESRSVVTLGGQEIGSEWFRGPGTALLRDWMQGEPSTSAATTPAAISAASARQVASPAAVQAAGTLKYIGNITLVHCLGEGGQGEVWSAMCFDDDGECFMAAAKFAGLSRGGTPRGSCSRSASSPPPPAKEEEQTDVKNI